MESTITKRKRGRPATGRLYVGVQLIMLPSLETQLTQLAQQKNMNRSKLIRNAIMTVYGHELENLENEMLQTG